MLFTNPNPDRARRAAAPAPAADGPTQAVAPRASLWGKRGENETLDSKLEFWSNQKRTLWAPFVPVTLAKDAPGCGTRPRVHGERGPRYPQVQRRCLPVPPGIGLSHLSPAKLPHVPAQASAILMDACPPSHLAVPMVPHCRSRTARVWRRCRLEK